MPHSQWFLNTADISNADAFVNIFVFCFPNVSLCCLYDLKVFLLCICAYVSYILYMLNIIISVLNIIYKLTTCMSAHCVFYIASYILSSIVYRCYNTHDIKGTTTEKPLTRLTQTVTRSRYTTVNVWG